MLKHVRLGSDVIWLYGANIISVLLPIILISKVSRVLGPAEWGSLAIADAVGRYVQVIVEYGFQISSTRDIACAVHPVERGRVVSQTMAAQIVLATLSIPTALFAVNMLGFGHISPLLLLCGILWGTCQAMNLCWYFQGVESVRTFAFVDFTMRAITVAIVLFSVNSPADSWRVSGGQALSSFGSLLVCLIIIAKREQLARPRIRAALSKVRHGLSLFAFRASGTLYISLSVVLLGIYATKVQVGQFAAAERVCRLTLLGLYPLSQLLYVRISREQANPLAQTALAKRSSALLSLLGVLAAFALWILGPTISHILFGKEFTFTGDLLRWFAAVLLITNLNSTLTACWLLPFRADRIVTTGSVLAAVAHLFLSLLLIHPLGPNGVLISLLLAELLMFGLFFKYLRSRGIRNPFWSTAGRTEMKLARSAS